MRSAASFVLLLLSPEFPATAMTVGPGGASCAEFAEQYGRSPTTVRMIYLSWAQGYMSGVYSAASATAEAMGRPQPLYPLAVDADAWFRRLRQFCDGRPLAGFDAAVIDLMQTIDPTLVKPP